VVPALATQQFALARDQTRALILVYEGATETDNRLLGSFSLEVPSSAEKVVTVTFLVDTKAKLSVQAKNGDSISHLDFVGVSDQQIVQRD